MKKKVILLITLILISQLYALGRPIMLKTEDYNSIVLLYKKGLLGKLQENKEILSTNNSMNTFEASKLVGDFLLKHLYNPDANLRKILSYHDLKNILETAMHFNDNFDLIFILNRDKISRAINNLKLQVSIAQKELIGTEFKDMEVEEYPEGDNQSSPSFISSVKHIFSDNTNEDYSSVKNTNYHFDKMMSDAEMNFYLKNYDEALMKFIRARRIVNNQVGSISHAKALFWTIRTEIILKQYNRAEKLIKEFARLKYPSNIIEYDIKDGRNIFIEAEDACLQKKDSEWLNYWAGSLYLHNGSNMNKSYEHFKKIIDNYKNKN